ncbi:hypothetical protein QOT17_018702 [Balamuthia mandrillaris]
MKPLCVLCAFFVLVFVSSVFGDCGVTLVPFDDPNCENLRASTSQYHHTFCIVYSVRGGEAQDFPLGPFVLRANCSAKTVQILVAGEEEESDSTQHGCNDHTGLLGSVYVEGECFPAGCDAARNGYATTIFDIAPFCPFNEGTENSEPGDGGEAESSSAYRMGNQASAILDFLEFRLRNNRKASYIKSTETWLRMRNGCRGNAFGLAVTEEHHGKGIS